MQKKIITLCMSICISLGIQMHAMNKGPSEDEKKVQLLGNYGIHFMSAATGFALLAKTAPLMRKLATAPIALTMIAVGAEPFTPGSRYFYEMEHGARANPFSGSSLVMLAQKAYTITESFFSVILQTAQSLPKSNQPPTQS